MARMGHPSKKFYEEILQLITISASQLAGHLRYREARQKLFNSIIAPKHRHLNKAVVLKKKKRASVVVRCKSKDDKFRCGEGDSKLVEMKLSPRIYLKQVVERVIKLLMSITG